MPLITPFGTPELSTPDLPIVALGTITNYGVMPLNPPTSVGWYFEVLHSNGEREQIGPALSGEFSFDTGRDVCKALSGFVLIPSEARKVDFTVDQLIAYIVIDGSNYPLGIFAFTEVTIQKAAVLDPDFPTVTTDLYNVSLGDRTVLAIRNDGSAETINKGFNPAQELTRILDRCKLPHSIPGSGNTSLSSVSWDGTAKDLDKVRGLATLAGFRNPWADNFGIVKAIIANDANDFEELDMLGLFPIDGSITITPRYFGAPNRVIVTDNSFASFAIRGIWEAPSVAPHSYQNRGFWITETVDQQGMGSSQNADQVAARIGQSYTARTLDFQCEPTYLIDGPLILSYDDAFWIVQSWTLSTDPGAVMSVNAVEFFFPSA